MLFNTLIAKEVLIILSMINNTRLCETSYISFNCFTNDCDTGWHREDGEHVTTNVVLVVKFKLLSAPSVNMNIYRIRANTTCSRTNFVSVISDIDKGVVIIYGEGGLVNGENKD